MQQISEFLFAKRRTPFKWVAILPALVAFVFAGHAFDDDGLLGALPYIAIIGISVAYLVRPTVALWIPLFGVFTFFAGFIALKTEDGLHSEGFLFGLIPAILMFLAWPLKAHKT